MKQMGSQLVKNLKESAFFDTQKNVLHSKRVQGIINLIENDCEGFKSLFDIHGKLSTEVIECTYDRVYNQEKRPPSHFSTTMIMSVRIARDMYDDVQGIIDLIENDADEFKSIVDQFKKVPLEVRNYIYEIVCKGQGYNRDANPPSHFSVDMIKSVEIATTMFSKNESKNYLSHL